VTDQRYAVILIYSTSHALRAEKLLSGVGIANKLIPVPRHLSSDCGVCVRIANADRTAAERVLAAVGLEIQGIFEV